MSYYRRVKSKNEMTQYFVVEDIKNEFGINIRVRGKRLPKHLPNSWDDYPKCCLRNWKKYRKKQYKQ